MHNYSNTPPQDSNPPNAHLDRLVACFNGVGTFVTAHESLRTVCGRMQDGTYQGEVERVRTFLGDAKAYKDAKKHLPSFTPCCNLTTRLQSVKLEDKLLSCTDVVQYDFDNVPDPEALRAHLATDPYCVFAFISPSGKGVKAGFAVNGITCAEDYKRAWLAFSVYLTATYPAVAFSQDPLIKYLHALCFVSHDPTLYLCEQPQVFPVPPAPRGHTPPQGTRAGRTPAGAEQARVKEALRAIPAEEYKPWVDVGMALHSTDTPWARALWDAWSMQSEKYDETTQQQTWDSFTADGGVTLATLFHLAHAAGWRPPPPPDEETAARHDQGAQDPSAPCSTIFLNTDMTRIVDETQAALLALPAAPIVYHRARHLAVIARGVLPPKWLRRPNDMPVIIEASHARLTELATQAAHYSKLDKRSKKWERALPPAWVIDTLLARAEWAFPVLEGLIASPTLRPDGSVLDTPGYDADTGLYLDTNGTTFPPLPAHPTLDDARTAIGHLQEAVQDFPFTEDWHFSATIAAILSLVCRCAVHGNVPLFAIRANTRGSGKSLLADVISILGTGSAAPRWPQVKEEEEERKRLLTVALAGYACLHIDNVTRPLGSPSLELALTSPTFSDRLLGVNQPSTVPLNMVWLASGNNMQFHGDTARRVVPIDLDPKMERPEERTGFAHDPLLPWLHQVRPRLTVAALTIVTAFFTAGCPAQGLTPLGSFEQWSDVIRQAVVWAGEEDPCKGRKDIEAESNPEYEIHAGVLTAWHACYSAKAMTLREAIGDIQQGQEVPRNKWGDLFDALAACDRRFDGKRLDGKRIGNALRTWQGRFINGLRLVSPGKGHAGYALWSIEGTPIG